MTLTRIIPVSWLVSAKPRRVITHWTAGSYRVSDHDLECYHFILEDQVALKRGVNVKAYRGDHSVADNDYTGDDDYASHCGRCNTASIGLSVACMAGAARGKAGAYPLTSLLWERLAQAAAECCAHYDIPVTEQTVLQHGEVERFLGIKQSGKWDCTWKPWAPDESAASVGAEFRRKTAWFLKQL